MTEEKRAANFIEEFIDEDLKAGRFDRVHTRFPPEPNGYLHIGHAKALCIDFGIAKKYGGECNLRFDDTNPTKEDTEYVDGIMEDIRWLGYEWKNLYFASDFFDKLYEIACEMIRKGVAYVDDQSSEEMRKNRGTLRTPGVNSPYRDRSPEENLDLFQRMKAGEFPDGSRVLRAKIDMASPNVLMRDPTMYRILRHHHHRARVLPRGRAGQIRPGGAHHHRGILRCARGAQGEQWRRGPADHQRVFRVVFRAVHVRLLRPQPQPRF